MQTDRDRLVLPGKGRVRHDDRHLRKIHRHVVDRHGVAVLQPNTAAASHPCADAAVPGVKEHGKTRFGKDLVQRIGDAIVREELLNGRMQLQSMDEPRINESARFADAFLSTVRVDTGEGDRDIRVVGSEARDDVIGNGRTAGEPFVDREHDARHVARAVVRRNGCRIASYALGAEVLARRRIRLGLSGALGLEVHVCVDRDQTRRVELSSVSHRAAVTSMTSEDGCSA
jgi:hypothetical protein